VNTLNNFLLIFPPVTEQQEIAEYLDTKTAQIDQIIQTINTQIEKLKELRKTLINDVVTGKIKVIDNGELKMDKLICI
jgi:type I restriction enzyme S subunit